MILDVDLSQIEWRTVAALTNDKVMMDEIRLRIDQHMAAATDLMELAPTKENRQDAKIFNFRAIYANPETAAYAYFMDPKMPSFTMAKWQKVMDGFYGKYHGMFTTHEEWVQEVRRKGQIIGPTGRRWVFQKVNKKGIWDYSVTQIRNYPVQGTAGDIIKLALVYISKRLRKDYADALLAMTVHDSIIFDLPEKIVLPVARICIDTFNEIPDLLKKHFNWTITIPIDGEAEAGPSWGKMERII
jgi:DNA polymerase-1